MKKNLLLTLMLALCLTGLCQRKLTPQARLSLEKQKAMMWRGNKTDGQLKNKALELQQVRLVLEVAKENASQTFDQIKAVGGKVLSKLGRQAVISLPIDSVDALERIEGVTRIDKGHKGYLKTDVVREETNVNQLNGPELPEGITAFTGKGVTVCLVDVGIDFQHRAFKDAEGRSRIKCVYLMGDDDGNKFTVNDPEAGEYTFPGSVYDTPELIATLTTDYLEYHGTHTGGIAAGSISPQGFGGMAPEADLVIIPLNDEVEGFEDENSIVELALAFAAAYAEQSEQPVVLSASMNSHDGPHDGTSSVTYAIEAAAENLIPVFSAGNEGGYPVHLYNRFTAEEPSVKSLLLGIVEDDSGRYAFIDQADVNGYTRTGDEVSISVSLINIDMMTGQITTVWTSETCTATLGGEDVAYVASSWDDETLGTYFDGLLGITASDYGDGRLCIGFMAEGGVDDFNFFEINLSGPEGTEIDLWDNVAGFGGIDYFGLPEYVDGDSEMSAGDWTSTDRVISVGAYCANVLKRDYDGNVTDTSVGDPDDNPDVLGDIAWFSSYGTSINNVSQPTVCAPGVSIVSAFNQYVFDEDATIDESMQWEGSIYSSESGTSMACPAVAGIVALWLEANPSLTLDDIKEVLSNTSRNDTFTESDPDRWGYGKIDAAEGIAYILTSTGINDLTSGKPQQSGLYDLQGRRLTGTAPAHGIYIRNGRKVVVQ